MKMKPAHFTLIRFHHVLTSECLQHPGNKGKDLRNVQKLNRTQFLWIISGLFGGFGFGCLFFF